MVALTFFFVFFGGVTLRGTVCVMVLVYAPLILRMVPASNLKESQSTTALRTTC